MDPNFQSYHFTIVRMSSSQQEIKRNAKEQERMAYSLNRGRGNVIETIFGEAQILNLLDTDFNPLKYAQRAEGNHGRKMRRFLISREYR